LGSKVTETNKLFYEEHLYFILALPAFEQTGATRAQQIHFLEL